MRGTVDALFDDWMEKLEPIHAAWSASSAGFADYVTARSDDVAEAMLSVTDERAERSNQKTAKKLYKKMRGSAKSNVVQAVPKLGALLSSYVETGSN